MGMAAAELHEMIPAAGVGLGGDLLRDATSGPAVAEFVDVLHGAASYISWISSSVRAASAGSSTESA